MNRSIRLLLIAVVFTGLTLSTTTSRAQREEDPPRDRPRETDRPRDGERREGERGVRGERREGERREGERREGERREGERREGERDVRRTDREAAEFRPQNDREALLFGMIQQLRRELQLLRREVAALRGGGRDRAPFGRGPAGDRRGGDGPRGELRRDGGASPEGPGDDDAPVGRRRGERDAERERAGTDRDAPRDRDRGERDAEGERAGTDRDTPRDRDRGDAPRDRDPESTKK